MSTRLDRLLQASPEHSDGIRLLASRDPSGKLKYLDWGVKVLVSGQALAPEIADVVEMFHRFGGRSFLTHRVHADLYVYQPSDLAFLRNLLLKIQRASDRKRRQRERLYRIEGAIEADVIYDSADLIVRHIKNKQASVHYGLSTKWCIAMLREGYFEDYDTNNATFFFFERKAPLGDEFDKVALLVSRNERAERGEESSEAFTSLDRRVDMMRLARVYGVRVFGIFSEIYECSERHPPSTMSQVYAGAATAEQLVAALANITQGQLRSHELGTALQAFCCNDAAPAALLEDVLQQTPALTRAAWRRQRGAPRGVRRWRRRRSRRRTSEAQLVTKEATKLKCTLMAAMTVHPNVSAERRATLHKTLRRHHIIIETIRRDNDYGRVCVAYDMRGGHGDDYPRGRRHLGRIHYRRRRRRPMTVKALRRLAEMYARKAVRMRKRAKAAERKARAAAKKKTKRLTGGARRKVLRKRRARVSRYVIRTPR